MPLAALQRLLEMQMLHNKKLGSLLTGLPIIHFISNLLAKSEKKPYRPPGQEPVVVRLWSTPQEALNPNCKMDRKNPEI